MMKFYGLMVFLFVVVKASAQLKIGFYNDSCPEAETIIRNVVLERFAVAPTVTAALLRMQFHDCFVRGCDASILLDTIRGGQPSEKAAIQNRSVREFDLINKIKAEVEATCPNTVSCADVIALATRDSIVLAGGPSYNVPTGRRDGVISTIAEVHVPGPSIAVTEALEFFAKKGIHTFDTVALLGAHTVGQANCGFFRDRLTDFHGSGKPDPSMDPDLIFSLKKTCLSSSSAALDQSTVFSFDNNYFKQLLQRKGVMEIDQSIANDPRTSAIVDAYSSNNTFFKLSFVQAIVKMGAVDIITGNAGQIRKICNVVNE